MRDDEINVGTEVNIDYGCFVYKVDEVDEKNKRIHLRDQGWYDKSRISRNDWGDMR